jgi:hypothetical protein
MALLWRFVAEWFAVLAGEMERDAGAVLQDRGIDIFERVGLAEFGHGLHG